VEYQQASSFRTQYCTSGLPAMADGPRDNGRRVDYRRYPARPIFVREFGAQLHGDTRIIEPDLLLDDAIVPDRVKIEFARPPPGTCPRQALSGNPGRRVKTVAPGGWLGSGRLH